MLHCMTKNMYSTEIADLQATGRASSQIYSVLRNQVLEGALRVGNFLPAERRLSEEFNVAHTTIRRALAKLQAEGLIRAEPRKGYRVLGKANDPLRGCPLAYIRSARGIPAEWDEFHARLMAALQHSADRQGWPLVVMGEGAVNAAKVRARLSSSHAWGAILDSNDPDTLAAVRDASIPAVMIDSWIEGSGFDSVLQDGHMGGILACRALAEAGCRRISWLGPTDRNVHVLDRFGGYCAGLLNHGLPLESSLVQSTGSEDALACARKMLRDAQRPDGFVTFWSTHAVAIIQAADELGLTVGQDIHLIGWTPDELYEGRFSSQFKGLTLPTVITWELRAMADAATTLLLERRANPHLPPLRVRVPVRLRTPDGRRDV